jgi:hypothetical protein
MKREKKMEVSKIQAKIAKKKQEIETLEKEIKEQLAKKSINSSEWLDVSDVLPNCEVELNVHDKGKSYDDLGLKDKEEQLLTVEQCIALANSKYAIQLKMDGSSSSDDFFIKQPLNRNKEKGYVADFYSGRFGSVFDSGRDSGDADVYRGVRFVRKKKFKNGKK